MVIFVVGDFSALLREWCDGHRYPLFCIQQGDLEALVCARLVRVVFFGVLRNIIDRECSDNDRNEREYDGQIHFTPPLREILRGVSHTPAYKRPMQR